MTENKKSPSDIVKRWYQGKFVPHENEPNSPVVFLGWNYERHWTAKTARVLVEFYLAHWQWLIGTVIAVLSLWVAVLALKP